MVSLVRRSAQWTPRLRKLLVNTAANDGTFWMSYQVCGGDMQGTPFDHKNNMSSEIYVFGMIYVFRRLLSIEL